jgi:hypothetical protein
MISANPVRLGFVAMFAAAGTFGAHEVATAQGAAGSVKLAPHIAIYDLTLTSSRGKRALESVRGRIVYDFSGSACEGYALQLPPGDRARQRRGQGGAQRPAHRLLGRGRGQELPLQVAELHGPQQIGDVDGRADRGKASVAVKLSKPEDKKFDAGTVVFPTEHMRLLIEAAKRGKTLLEVAVYDGSESGEKIYQSLSVIGRRIEPEKKPTMRRPTRTRSPGSRAGR